METRDRLMTLPEVAELIGIPVATLYRWRGPRLTDRPAASRPHPMTSRSLGRRTGSQERARESPATPKTPLDGRDEDQTIQA
jgi:predicted DNA-binding transcriptional regulator AlpA